MGFMSSTGTTMASAKPSRSRNCGGSALLARDDHTQAGGAGVHTNDARDGAHGVELLERRVLCVFTLGDTKDQPATLTGNLEGAE
jgi:hypothetical protein